MEKKIISVRGLKKYFKDVKAVDDISFEVREGELFAFLGLNGAGKSTTINILCGVLPKDAGEVIVDGTDIDGDIDAVKSKIGIVFQGGVLDKELSVADNLRYKAALYGITGRIYAERLEELSSLLGLKDLLKRPLGKLSGGQKRRIDIARALLHKPKILILDEPTTGLDPLMRDAFLEIIEAEHKKGKTVFMSGHMFEELETTCDRVAMIRSGRLVDVVGMREIENRPTKEFKIEFSDRADYLAFKRYRYTIVRDQPKYNQVTVAITGGQINRLFFDLTSFNVKFISEVKYTLEKHFREVLEKETQRQKEKEKRKNVQ